MSSEEAVDRSLATTDTVAGRVPAAIRAAAGASTAVMVCQDDGALERSSTSVATCCLSLAAGLDLTGVAAVVVVEVVVVVVGIGWLVVVFGRVVVEVVVLVAGNCFVFVAETTTTGAVSLIPLDLWPKLAASLLEIWATAPGSPPPEASLTARTRVSWFAVGVDLMTRRSTRCCSKPETVKATANKKAMQIVSLMICLSCCLVGGLVDLVSLVVIDIYSFACFSFY